MARDGERHETFTVGERPTVDVGLASGSLRFSQGPPGTVQISVHGRNLDDLEIVQRGDRIVVRKPQGRGIRWHDYDIAVVAPADVAVEARLASADLAVEGTAGSVRADLASGDCRAGHVTGDLAVKTASGDVEVADVGGSVHASCASGDVRVGRAGGDATLNSASGQIELGSAESDVTARSASGDVLVRSYLGTDLNVTSMSGEVRLGLPSGRTIDLDLSTLSGRVRNRFDLDDSQAREARGNGERVRLRVKTVSGDITLEPAS